ncbi:MAG: methyltransferase [Thermodesulfobacteriota bacterium]|nr:methyltransferase [Thermodesulfobacteriota bacterium]
MVHISDSEKIDPFLKRRLLVIQKKDGYRFSVEAVILANYIDPSKDDKLIDLGTGCGIIPLILAQKKEIGGIVGIEIQKDLADLARRNIKLNNFGHCVRILEEDFRNVKSIFKRAEFDLVVSNPPFFRADSGRINPQEEKAMARHEIKGSLYDLIEISAYLVKPGGKVIIVYPAARLIDVISCLEKNKLKPKILQLIYSDPKSSGKLVIIESKRGNSSEIKIKPAFFIRDNAGIYTSVMEEYFS